MDTIYNTRLSYTSYILVTKKNGDNFKVYVDGKQSEIKYFFEDALKEWKQHK